MGWPVPAIRRRATGSIVFRRIVPTTLAGLRCGVTGRRLVRRREGKAKTRKGARSADAKRGSARPQTRHVPLFRPPSLVSPGPVTQEDRPGVSGGLVRHRRGARPGRRKEPIRGRPSARHAVAPGMIDAGASRSSVDLVSIWCRSLRSSCGPGDCLCRAMADEDPVRSTRA